MRFSCVALLVAIALADCALAVDPIICGYVVEQYCAGCTPTNPGGCGCGEKSGGSCACVDSSGNPQNGTLVQCTIGYYGYSKSMSGKRITASDTQQECGSAKTCQVTDGLCSGDPPCTSGSCTWEVVTTYFGTTYTEGEKSCGPPR
jgi:hypothetical protein